MAKELTKEKAKEMLANPPHKTLLTKKQKHYFGMVAGGVPMYEEGGEMQEGGWLDKYSSLPEIIPENSLTTFNFGSVSGTKQTPAKNKLIHQNIINTPEQSMADGGESWNEAYSRMISTLKDIRENAPANTTIVTHNSVFGAIKSASDNGFPEQLSKKLRIEYTKQDGKHKTGDSFTINGTNGPIYIVRHGETEDNVEGNFRHADTQLTDKGIKQAQTLGEKLRNVNVPQIITSPLPRAINTANIIANAQDNKKKDLSGSASYIAQNGGEYLGTTNRGEHYNSAWGGSFQNGGIKYLNFLEPTDEKLPEGYKIPNRYPSTELAVSIGGENGEPAYLIPSFKYGHPLDNPREEFRNTGDYLGGPFKTWQEADKWDKEIRHPYVAKGQDIPSPVKTWGEGFQNGGWLDKFEEGGSVPNKEMSVGMKVEVEHKPTLDFIKKYYKEHNKFPTLKNLAKSIATDHIKDFKNIKDPKSDTYYKGLVENHLTDEVSKYLTGGNIPGTPGFTYARTSSTPSKGKYGKTTISSALNGTEMQYYQQGRDWQPKMISEDGGIIQDNNGYWNPDNWGKPVQINSNNITMKGVNMPLWGISDTQDARLMFPGRDYHFKGKSVLELPIALNGISQQNDVNGHQLEQLTSFYNKPSKGKWLEKYK